jgi:nitronate monooxygenase
MDLSAVLNVHKAIIQAPMAGVQDSRLAIAVTTAGGLGSIPCAMLSDAQIIHQIEQLKAHQVNSYNLNFFCHSPPTP